MDLDRLKELCADSDLEYDQIKLHQRRISSVLRNKLNSHLKILDTCRLDNNGVIDINTVSLSEDTLKEEKIVAFVPAAGASTRFFSPFGPLVEALRAGDIKTATVESKKLIDSGILKCSLRSEIRNFFETSPSEISQEDLDKFLNSVEFPKALQRCNHSNLNFLEYKIQEHETYSFIQKNVFVINPQFQSDFESLDINHDNVSFYFQGNELSTIRFDKDCSPVLDDGKLSPVPAGHGTLIRTLVQLKNKQPELTCAFIRNIDNTPELDPANVEFTQKVATYFSEIHKWMKCIRQALDSRDLKNAEYFAERILNIHSLKVPLEQTSSLIAVLKYVFHKPDKILDFNNNSSIEVLSKLYKQPISIMGQVPNLGKDIGGSPVFVDSPNGPVKLCIELPHVSEEDKQSFLIDSAKLTYFNPVFVFCELTAELNSDEAESSPYWIIAKKQHRGEDVFYHETVLYELLGNSALANPVFIEIPRSLFTPNKVIFDSITR